MMAAKTVLWSKDKATAYLVDEGGTVLARWFKGNPGASTFDLTQYQLGRGTPQNGWTSFEIVRGPGVAPSPAYYETAPGVGGATALPSGYAAGTSGGVATPTETGGGYYQDYERMTFDELVREFNLKEDEVVAARKEYARQWDEDLQLRTRQLEQDMETTKMQIASSEGMQKYDWEQKFKELAQEHANAVELQNLDWEQKQILADKQLAMDLKQILSNERIQAAQIAAQPINYRVYEQWLAGLPAYAHESGLPAGAPLWLTETGEEGGTVPGAEPGTSPYAAAYASGARIPEFQEWGGSTEPVGGEPWVSPYQVNLTQFALSPEQSQQMAYARWRERGILPETAKQQMYAAAPVGTAPKVVAYG
jgi:hypothetical protein